MALSSLAGLVLAAAALMTPASDLAAEAGEEGPPLRLQYHDIRTDAAGMILPWSHDDPARAYDHVVRLVWGFWQGMERCPNGVPYYLQHQVWKPEHDPRGLGGDQLSMALSSWNLLHGYLGDPAVVANMRAHRRLLAGERDDREGRPLAERAVPVQHGGPLRPLRRRHGGGQGLPPAGQGGGLRGRARGPPQDHGRPPLPRGRHRDRRHARAQREGRRRRSLAVALPRPRGDRRGVRLEERALRLHDELDGRPPPLRLARGDGPGARRGLRAGASRS